MKFHFPDRREDSAALLHRRFRLLALLTVASVCLSATARAQSEKVTRIEKAFQQLQAEHRESQHRFADGLEKIAQASEARNLATAAAKIRRVAQPSDPEMLRFEPLPRFVQPPIPPDLPEAEAEWRVQLRDKQKWYAAKLDELATRAVRAGLPSYAFQLIREAAFHDSDHPRARRLLGFVRHEDEWLSQFAAEKLKKKEVWHERFGWLPAAHVARYEQGMRPPVSGNGDWISVEREAELRSDFRKAWKVETEHYLLRTNDSLERGVALASALEEFHRFFQHTFAAFFSDSDQLKKLFSEKANAAARNSAKPFEIHFYRSKDEYVDRLIRKYKQIGITNGLYDTDDRIVYSFHNPAIPPETTLYHEATHQLLAARLPASPVLAAGENFWLIEGIACYIESFQRQEGRVSLGDPRYIRFEAARFRLLNDGYYLPLAEFTSMGRYEFQQHRQIQNNYSQAAGLVHFFIHYDGGRYRDDLIEHLRQIYAAADQPRQLPGVVTLERLTGESFAELDRQYAEYTRELEAAVQKQALHRP